MEGTESPSVWIPGMGKCVIASEAFGGFGREIIDYIDKKCKKNPTNFKKKDCKGEVRKSKVDLSLVSSSTIGA